MLGKIISLCIVLLLSHTTSIEMTMIADSSPPSSPVVPALYVFGDSLVDSGNNNWLVTLAKANYPPYGVDFQDGPTGRFSNGKTVADFIAEYLRVPYPPPYLKVLRAMSLEGYNYASGSCGILPKTGSYLGVCLSLGEQIRLFETTIRTELAMKLSPTQLTQHLSKSIFLFSVGNNDYINDYFRIGSSSSRRYSPQQFAQLLIDALSQKLQRLYHLGARKVVFFELGPIGCIPSYVRNEKPTSGNCVEDKNKVISFFNDKLGLMLQNLTSTLKDSHFILGHVNSLGYDAVLHPQTYGLSDSANPCCRAWKNGTFTCIPALRSCKNPNKHYFWDGYHLTQATASVIASRCFYDSSVCLPMNIQQLAQI